MVKPTDDDVAWVITLASGPLPETIGQRIRPSDLIEGTTVKTEGKKRAGQARDFSVFVGGDGSRANRCGAAGLPLHAWVRRHQPARRVGSSNVKSSDVVSDRLPTRSTWRTTSRFTPGTGLNDSRHDRPPSVE